MNAEASWKSTFTCFGEKPAEAVRAKPPLAALPLGSTGLACQLGREVGGPAGPKPLSPDSYLISHGRAV